MTDFYCQNTSQSGDTTGVGLALLLHPQRHLLLLVNYNEISRALNFLTYYRALGIGRVRLHVVLCDVDAEQRSVHANARRDAGTVQNTRTTYLNRLSTTGLAGRAQGRAANFIAARRNVLERDLVPAIVRRQQKRVVGGRFADASAVHDLRRLRRPAERELAELSGEVRVWDDPYAVLGCNQVYQTISNPDEAPPPNYQVFFQTALHTYSPIGQTTTDLKNLVETTGTTAPQKCIHQAFGRSRVEEIDRYAEAFLELLLGEGPRRPVPIKDRPVVVLIWIRGLSGGELRSVQASGIRPDQIDDTQLRRLEAFKKNPHHVMTVQLYQTLLTELRRLSESSGRRFIGVPIGDSILYDQYCRADDENVFLGRADDNLIGFFGRCRAFQKQVGEVTFPHRFNQLYFLYKLFQNSRCQVMQIGIRSGAMEGGMYMGMPTVYIEEKFSSSGPRMAQLTQNGGLKADLDRLFLQARAAAGNDEESIRRLSRLRDIVQEALLPTSIQQLPEQYIDAIFDMWAPDGRTANLDALRQNANQIRLRVNARAPGRTGFPFFYRLVVENLIGLNQMRGHDDVDDVLDAVVNRTLNAEPRLLRGTLTGKECDVLRGLFHLLGEGNPAYQHDLKSWSPKPLKGMLEYLPE